MTSSEPKILIISTRVDLSTDYVIEKLSKFGAGFIRINTEDFPITAESSFRINHDAANPAWLWSSESQQSFALNEIRSVWYRRHRLPQLPESVVKAHAEYSLRESEWFLRGCIYAAASSSNISWMSHPTCLQTAESKIYQLTQAKSIGLRVPSTLISNSPNTIRRFFETNNGRIIAKPLRLGYFDYGERQTSVYTNEVQWDHLLNDSSLKLAPVIFQELVTKRFDIRVTIVGELVFAAAIHSQDIESARIDWRKTNDENLAHSKHELPDSVTERCLELMRTLGLAFGALDLVLTPEGDYVFLEVNPNGQWVWLEDKLEFPISESIAAWLLEHSQN